MSEHVERMKKEHADLLDKITKLEVFIFSNDLFKAFDSVEQARMIKQLGFMESYKSILESRIWASKG